MSRRVAHLVFQSHRKGSYLHDGAVSIASGRLRENGVHSDVFETVLDGERVEQNRALIARLAQRLVDGGYGVLITGRIWDPKVIWTLREELDARTDRRPILLFVPRKMFGESSDPYDIVNPRGNWRVMLEVAQAPEPFDPNTIGGLLVRDESGQFVPSAAGEGPEYDDTDPWTLRPDFRRIQIHEGQIPKSTHLVAYGNPGCPYRRSIREVPFWAEVKVDPEITNTKGCSFCNINLSSDYRFVKGISTHVVEQIAHIQADGAANPQIILLDQDPFPYLPEVFEQAIERELPPFHLLIQARADLFVRRKEKYEKAMELARQGGYQCTPFLVGVENFHQETLEFYNKGVTVETNIEVLRYLREIARRFPDVFDPAHVSPGFIMWHPWVTFESLRTNVDAIQEYGFNEFRSEVALSKIRLYPDIPLYWKAKEDGLLARAYSDVGLDSARRYGYPEEAPYRFAHGEAQVAYTLLAALCRRYEPIEELKLLALILDWVDAHPEQCTGDELLALSDPDALVALFESEHGDAVQALRRKDASERRSVTLTPRAESVLRAAFAPHWPGAGAGPSGYELARVIADNKRIQLFFAHPDRATAVYANPREADFRVAVEPRGEGRAFIQTDRWNLTYAAPDGGTGLSEVIGAICNLAARRLAELDDAPLMALYPRPEPVLSAG